MEFKKYALYLIVLIGAVSCVPKKKVVYLQGAAGSGNASLSNYEPTIQPDDLLYVTVSSQNPEAVTPFNPQIASSSIVGNDIRERAYLVSKDGFIQYPIIGNLKAAGLTRAEFTDMLRNMIKPYVSDAIINLKFLNFKVTVLGEVGRPGKVSVDSDRITLLEAIAQSGDLTLYGQRENILIVRDNNGEKSFNRVDITKADFVNSPFYYLKQNDLVYIEPRRAKVDSTAIGGNVSTIMSILSFLITTTLIITRL
jgi:polysaccharide export outer membrane protein